jgi:two-component system, OmpR family, phosphate regulon sensor histidine kinase PhoR
MNRRIRSIFWLMTICIVGINTFQGYWLWTTWQLNRQQFTRTVQEALFQALEQQQVVEASRLFDTKNGDSATAKTLGRSQIIIRQYDTAIGEKARISFNRTSAGNSLSSTIGGANQLRVTYNLSGQRAGKNAVVVQVDTLAQRISKLLVLGWTAGDKVNLRTIQAAYRTELLRRAVDAPFQLDTFTLQPQQTKGNVLVFDSRHTRTDTNGIVRTAPMPLNPVRHLFLQASFGSPTSYLLRQMGWLLGGSGLLLLLTTGCFLFMLATILRQKKLSEVKSDFINNMTHEFKTPIATVTAAIEALQYFGALNDPQKTKTYLAISQNNLQRLSDLVEKVLNLAVEEKRDLVIDPAPINLVELVNELIINHKLRTKKTVNFTILIPTDTSVSVDRVHFGNALNNLIDNAINYSHDTVQITLTFRPKVNGWQLAVADNGIGVPKAYQSAIFDRFFRVPTGNLHPVKGFGLGLAYVRQVVERHSGSISIQSEPGKGSEFLLDF